MPVQQSRSVHFLKWGWKLVFLLPYFYILKQHVMTASTKTETGNISWLHFMFLVTNWKLYSKKNHNFPGTSLHFELLFQLSWKLVPSGLLVKNNPAVEIRKKAVFLLFSCVFFIFFKGDFFFLMGNQTEKSTGKNSD